MLFECRLCEQAFSSDWERTEHLSSLLHHARWDRDQKSNGNFNALHYCDICETTLTSITDFSKHISDNQHRRLLDKLRRDQIVLEDVGLPNAKVKKEKPTQEAFSIPVEMPSKPAKSSKPKPPPHKPPIPKPPPKPKPGSSNFTPIASLFHFNQPFAPHPVRAERPPQDYRRPHDPPREFFVDQRRPLSPVRTARSRWGEPHDDRRSPERISKDRRSTDSLEDRRRTLEDRRGRDQRDQRVADRRPKSSLERSESNRNPEKREEHTPTYRREDGPSVDKYWNYIPVDATSNRIPTASHANDFPKPGNPEPYPQRPSKPNPPKPNPASSAATVSAESPNGAGNNATEVELTPGRFAQKRVQTGPKPNAGTAPVPVEKEYEKRANRAPTASSNKYQLMMANRMKKYTIGGQDCLENQASVDLPDVEESAMSSSEDDERVVMAKALAKIKRHAPEIQVEALAKRRKRLPNSIAEFAEEYDAGTFSPRDIGRMAQKVLKDFDKDKQQQKEQTKPSKKQKSKAVMEALANITAPTAPPAPAPVPAPAPPPNSNPSRKQSTSSSSDSDGGKPLIDCTKPRSKVRVKLEPVQTEAEDSLDEETAQAILAYEKSKQNPVSAPLAFDEPSSSFVPETSLTDGSSVDNTITSENGTKKTKTAGKNVPDPLMKMWHLAQNEDAIQIELDLLSRKEKQCTEQIERIEVKRNAVRKQKEELARRITELQKDKKNLLRKTKLQ